MAWVRWAEAAKELRDQRALLSKAVGRISLMAAFAAFSRWREVVVGDRAQRALLRKAAGRIMFRQQRLAFAQWQELCATTKHQRTARRLRARRAVHAQRAVRGAEHDLPARGACAANIEAREADGAADGRLSHEKRQRHFA